MSKRIALIGLGNSLRRDDGIGILVLESLLNNYKRQGLEYFNYGIASFDLIHRLQDYGKVLLIDAIAAGLPAGELRIFELKEISFCKEFPDVSSHELNLKDVFELSRRFGLKTKIHVAGIQVKDVSFGESISEPLRKKFEDNVRKIDEFILEKML